MNKQWLDLLETADISTSTKDLLANSYKEKDYFFVEQVLIGLLTVKDYSIILDNLVALLPQNQITKITEIN